MERYETGSGKKTLSRWLLLFMITLAVTLLPAGKTCLAAGSTYRVQVTEGYLALRTAKAFDYYNEIGKLYTGDTVEVLDSTDSDYWYVYSSKLDKYGYVNKDYLKAVSSSSSSKPVTTNTSGYWTVKVDSGYLALRTAKAFEYENEIGELYTGDTVQVQDTSDSTYWYVYAPSLGKSGYVNRNYLIAPSSYGWTVKVDSGYLALRTAKAFEYENEIGKLYTGDTVQVQDTSDDTYWYVYAPSLNKSGYVNRNYLIAPTGVSASGETWSVKVDSGYLALRTAKAFEYKNEIGELYTGDTVQVQDKSDDTYWYVYAPSLNKSGYVNKNYLVALASAPVSGETWTVRVESGYLALRTAKAFEYENEIGKLYTGDTVQVQDKSDSDYWYVYSSKLGKSGYVNRNYLVSTSSSSVSGVTKTVRVESGYLALRNAKAYDYSNEIGKLYTGETVQVQDTSDSTYWYVYAPTLQKYGYVNSNYLY